MTSGIDNSGINTYSRILFERENKIPVCISYNQKCISEEDRYTLVKWLMRVALIFSLNTEDLHLGIRLLDIYVSFKKKINIKNFQAVGLVCLSLGSKLHNENVDISYFWDISSQLYKKDYLLVLEGKILLAVQNYLLKPTVSDFLDCFVYYKSLYFVTSESSLEDSPLWILSHFLCDLALLDYQLARLVPSKLAAIISYYAQFILYQKFPTHHLPQMVTNDMFFDCKKRLYTILSNVEKDKKFEGVVDNWKNKLLRFDLNFKIVSDYLFELGCNLSPSAEERKSRNSETFVADRKDTKEFISEPSFSFFSFTKVQNFFV